MAKLPKGPMPQPTYKPGGGTGGQKGILGQTTSPRQQPQVQTRRDPKIWKKVKTEQGYTKWVKRGPAKKKELPLSKSKKKGSPRSYENIKKSKPLGKGRKKGVG